jgi:hypothetical protein
MVWYIAFIAVVNLGLGYALAVLFGGGGAKTAAAGDALASRERAEF